MLVHNLIIQLLTILFLPNLVQSEWLRPKLIAIGDLHGDYNQAIKTLKLANIIDNELKWSGGNFTTFVQTGDVVDRGPDTIKLYKLLKRLRKEAEEAGGLVIPLLGNHEVMNLAEDYRYVTEEDIKTFGSLKKRKEAFSKTGWVGRYLRDLNLTAIVEDYVFCHGGIHPMFAKYGNDRINEISLEDLKTLTPDELYTPPLYGNEGPLWYRGYALDTENAICSVLDEALLKLKVKRMVVGHTVQENGKIRTRCDGKIILIDVGISKVYGGFNAALELTEFGAKAIYENEQVVLFDELDFHDEL